MSNLHKIFKEMQKLNYEDFDLLCDAWREHQNVKMHCEHMGIRYSDKYLINSVTHRANIRTSSPLTTAPPNAPSQNNRDKKIEKIILGDNLDIIEEAAKKKGLI